MQSKVNSNLDKEKWKAYIFYDLALLISEKFDPKQNKEEEICIELEHISSENGMLLGHTSTKETLSIKNRFRFNDVLFGKLRPYLKKYYLAKFQGVCSTEIWVLRSKNNLCNSNYLFYIVQSSIFNKVANISAGTKMPRSDWNVVSNLVLKIPPLDEQKKIAEILGTIDRTLELTEKLITAKRKLKQGLMQKLLTGKLRFPEFVKSNKCQKYHFLSCPTDWKIYSIGEICREISNKNASSETTVLSCTKYDGLVPSLEYFGRKVYGDNLDKYKIVKRNQFAYATNHIEEGSIGLLKDLDIGLVSPIYTVFETKKSFVLPEYLILILKTEVYRKIFESLTLASVDRRGSLRWNGFSKIKVAIPNIDEQEKITKLFNKLTLEINCLEKKLLYLQEQKKGLMQQLLTGKIRVNQ
ncbi:MAG: restriction endonuclease subunit S [Cyanobacteria bacterium]|nr:restriction endonuclease subunit S [Cyanobacteria bacterium CG_2015-16_32_12]NCQ03587.1 restriction endonuclease subunit S [Cyanobacteria bacterium CG_2015-09_32_10]NCQ40314.1 restriction endonuclease subunit S [Cyanobacteria bacterium CG_2015-04_32_10]